MANNNQNENDRRRAHAESVLPAGYRILDETELIIENDLIYRGIDSNGSFQALKENEYQYVVGSKAFGFIAIARHISAMSDEDYRKKARELHAEEGHIEIDEKAKVSRGEDKGAYVEAWIWIEDDHIDDDDPDESSEPDSTVDNSGKSD